MQVRGGEFSNNLLKLIRPALRLELRTALYQATQQKTEVELQNVPVTVDGVTESLDIVVRPILRWTDTARGLTLILFRKRDETNVVERQPATIVSTSEPLALQLEEELLRVRSQLRATSEQHELQEEELKASNEELHAMNEELRSAAEELETSKEELQSLNEELTTVNQELKVKIEEISQASSDLNNLINSTGIGTIFLDRSHKVKLFTPRARDIFNFIPSDTGRRLSDITSALVDVDLMSDVDRVLEQLITIEREVSTTNGLTYLFRILPYRTLDDRINGVVLTFMDVTENRLAQEERHKAVARFRRATQIETVGIVFFSAEGEVTDCNDAFLLMSGYTRPELTERAVKLQVLPSREALDQFKSEGRITPFERQMDRRDGSTWWALFSATELDEGTGVEFVIDITKSKEMAAQLSEALELTEHNVQQRTSALADANAALADADTARTRILKQLVTAQEDERSRVARDLHDQLGQQLTALRLQLEIIKGRVVEDAKAYEQIEQAQVIARRIETEIDFLAWELRPLALDDLGLPEALNDYVQRWSKHSQIPVDFHTSGLDERLAPEIETNLYRIAQEALNNIHKHAGAESAELLLERRDHSVVLIVEDNGSGFDSTSKLPDGLGLISMRERAAVLNGTIEVESEPGKGTTIFARVPIPPR